jgi:hypothetical protein
MNGTFFVSLSFGLPLLPLPSLSLSLSLSFFFGVTCGFAIVIRASHRTTNSHFGTRDKRNLKRDNSTLMAALGSCLFVQIIRKGS